MVKNSKSRFGLILGGIGLFFTSIVLAELPSPKPISGDGMWQLSGSLATRTNAPLMQHDVEGSAYEALLNPENLFDRPADHAALSASNLKDIQTLMNIDNQVLSGLYKDAQESSRELLIQFPNSPPLIERQARIAMLLKDHALANAYWEILTNLAPRRGDLLAEQAWCLLYMDEVAQAREKVDRALQGPLNRPQILLLHNILEMKYGRPLSLTSHPDKPTQPIYLDMHQIVSLGEVIRYHRIMLEGFLGPYNFRRLCAWVLHAGRLDVGRASVGAKQDLESLWVVPFPKDNEVPPVQRSMVRVGARNWDALLYACAGHIYALLREVRAQKYQDALDRILVLKQLNLRSDSLELYRMEMLRLQGASEEWREVAFAFLGRALETQKNCGEVGRHLILMGAWDEAENLLRQGVFKFPDNPRIRYLLASSLALQGNSLGANDQARWLVRYHPHTLQIWLRGSLPMKQAVRQLPSVQNLYNPQS